MAKRYKVQMRTNCRTIDYLLNNWCLTLELVSKEWVLRPVKTLFTMNNELNGNWLIAFLLNDILNVLKIEASLSTKSASSIHPFLMPIKFWSWFFSFVCPKVHTMTKRKNDIFGKRRWHRIREHQEKTGTLKREHWIGNIEKLLKSGELGEEHWCYGFLMSPFSMSP